MADRFAFSWPRAAVAMLVMLGVAAAVGSLRPAEAQPAANVVLTSAPISADVGNVARVMLSNLGRRPVRVSLVVAEASDLTEIGASGPIVLQPGTSTSFDVTFQGAPTIFLAAVRAEARSSRALQGLRPSVQLLDGVSNTSLIFTDGFESGDIS